MPIHATIMFLAGMGIPVLAALNAALGVRLGAPVAAATVLFLVAFLVCAAVLLVTGPRPLTALPAAPRHLLLAGVLIAFYVLSITFIAPRFGIGNAVFFVLLGQLVSAAAIDHFGLFGAPVSPLDPIRAGGLGLMALGVWVTRLA